MARKLSVVLDLGFGDSGKGVTVDFLAAQAPPERSLVVRFSGGHQVSHTVALDGFRHTFSNFGAGSLRGVPTYYSEHTTFFPPALLLEYELLRAYKPRVFAHPLALLTTPFDIAYNRAQEKKQQHGSCGVGFGTTIRRNLESPVKLFIKDMYSPWAFEQRLRAVGTYYEEQLRLQGDKDLTAAYREELDGLDLRDFMALCAESRSRIELRLPDTLFGAYEHLIFEGSQGILLDQEHGFFPHVTPSYTTSKNALEILTQAGYGQEKVTIFYVTRCYQTRHGNGPMSRREAVSLIRNEAEANTYNTFQGHFRTAELDAELLNYALRTDSAYHAGTEPKKNLVITCLDQRPDFEPDSLLDKLRTNFEAVYGSYGAESRFFRSLSNSNE